jgi:hypothetical protein
MSEKKKLQHHHLIDGKYLKEDVMPMLHQHIEELIMECVPVRLQKETLARLEEYFKTFEDECVAYDRSRDYVEWEHAVSEPKADPFGLKRFGGRIP